MENLSGRSSEMKKSKIKVNFVKKPEEFEDSHYSYGKSE